ncbi:MAG: Rossman fold protein, TIGR00730 family [Candidatus Magasanikbacteria bacterium RIFOXYA2_FULL_44_8]|uniref:Cytokinin riboside 5'-monophosphate phosphoribohydrolase n=1 Tax=Candidatus Magasanikbacteria bacterium RIFOXYA2_FULL_44_8 TaxID=1798696 RepID=A0A1F6NKW7_9BACT|nr:MAG: Rossman fold protein, TIGR00730 family [Candidatus Magasanikbacteria bacterium RIFOXYA2_FULL_44_8]
MFCQGGPDWRIFRIMAELVEGFELLSNIKNDVTVLGTKSILPGASYYQSAYELGKTLADNKITVITGGGPGTMEAVNRGAFERGGESIGMNMMMDHAERHNNYLTKSIGFVFPFVRKLIITAPSRAFIFFPGGFGTLHQLFELLTLIETKKIEPLPLFLYGKAFWQPLLDYIHVLYADFRTINQMDEHAVRLVDSPGEIMAILNK